MAQNPRKNFGEICLISRIGVCPSVNFSAELLLYNLPEIAELIIAEGADVNLKDSDRRTPLWLAKERGYANIIELPKKHGGRE